MPDPVVIFFIFSVWLSCLSSPFVVISGSQYSNGVQIRVVIVIVVQMNHFTGKTFRSATCPFKTTRRIDVFYAVLPPAQE